jgi:hypothetical protein
MMSDYIIPSNKPVVKNPIEPVSDSETAKIKNLTGLTNSGIILLLIKDEWRWLIMMNRGTSRKMNSMFMLHQKFAICPGLKDVPGYQ